MAKTKESGGAMIKVDDWQIMAPGTAERMGDVIEANLGGEELRASDLEQIKIPAGGGKLWMMQDLSGEDVGVKEIVGVIVHVEKQRTWWNESFEVTGGGTPPDCASVGGNYRARIGIATSEAAEKYSMPRSGNCEECPHYQWGSADKGDGKACREQWLLFVLTQDSLLPSVVRLPPTSLGSARSDFFAKLIKRGLMPSDVVVRIGLDQKEKPVLHSVATFKVHGQLDPAVRDTLKAYSAAIAPSLKAYSERAVEQPAEGV